MSTSALSWRRERPAVLGYALAVLSVAGAIAIAFAFDRLVGDDPSLSLFLCAIVFVAWANGTGPALLATALAVLALAYFFLQPTYSLAPEFKEIPRLIFFAVAALFVVALSAAQSRAATALRSSISSAKIFSFSSRMAAWIESSREFMPIRVLRYFGS